MKYLFKNILIVVVSLIAIISCTERIDMEVDPALVHYLVVDGSITTDTMQHSVTLMRSVDYFSGTGPEMVTNANVRIEVSDGNIIPLNESIDNPGTYLTSPYVYGEIGKSYNLVVRDVDINRDGISEVYEAEDHINPIGKLDSIKLTYAVFPFDAKLWFINVYAIDPPTEDYYLFKAYVNDTLVSDSLHEYGWSDDRGYNGGSTKGIEAQELWFDDPQEATVPGDTVTFELDRVSEAFYEYVIQLQNASGYQNPVFSGPPANVITNVTNGGMGFFAAYSLYRASTIVPPEPWLPGVEY
jgi:hypothetical protein